MKIYSFAELVVRGFPTVQELDNPYIYGGVQVIINVSGLEYPEDILSIIESRGIRWHHFPLVEEGPNMGLDILLSAVRELIKADTAGERVVLHCSFGNNRSRTVAEAFYYIKSGAQFKDEYKGYPNHLLYNCGEGHLPEVDEMERILREYLNGPG